MTKQCEKTLPLRAVAQPHPLIHAEGDCGACVLAGLTAQDVQGVYAQLMDGKPDGISGPKMREICKGVECRGGFNRVVTDVPIWPTFFTQQVFGAPSWTMNLQWFGYLAMAIDAGFYGVTSINMDGGGPLSVNDHAILICGYRTTLVPHETMEGAGTYRSEILVSCSARHPDGRWYEHWDFLRRYGGFPLILVRP